MKFSTTALFIISTVASFRQSYGSYELSGNNVKCPYRSDTRLFRKGDRKPLSLEECHQLCYDTEGCQYFTIGVSAYTGVCIGCTEDAQLTDQDGMDSYEMTVMQDFPTASPVAASSCLLNGDSFTTEGCDYESIVQGLDRFLEDNTCGDHDADAVLDSLFPNTSPKDMINYICDAAWDQVPTSTFQDVDERFTDNFMEDYINGDSFLNQNTGTFQGTVEGNNIDSFRDDDAVNTVVQPIPSISTCTNNAIMCCFGRDRQPNDNNGNCADPIDTNCVNADPADNSNLCWTDTNIDTFADPFTFPGKSESPIHCHGLAWGEDDNSFTAQLRFNNFFYVSLYDHMYTRGYVETTVDSDNIGMCDCIENMPPVSRADCTQIDAMQTFTVTFIDGIFSAAASGDLDIEFNSCQGINPGNGNRKNNDLGSYVYRLNKEGDISDETMEGVFETLVGYMDPNDNQNEAACEAAYLEVFGEDYPDDVANLKCPLHSSERLFRTEDNDPLTLEQCQDMCYDTQFCDNFSLGLSGRHQGVCIGCTSNAVLESQRGFNSYAMTSTQSFPTASPTPESEYFDAVGTGKKCPFDRATRLFRTPDNSPLTRMDCYEECYNTEGCHYFSLGGADLEREAWVGVCMGCTEDAVLSNHAGFNAFEMEIKQDFPHDEAFAVNKKCPMSNRLFRTEDYSPLTKSECYDMCNDHPTCEYFTFGEGDSLNNAHKGLCIGCSGEANLSDHRGFNTYAILP